MLLKAILNQAAEAGASDVLIVIDMPPIIRISTELTLLKDFGDVDEVRAQEMLGSILDSEKIKRLHENRDIDFSTTIDDGTRFRVNAHFQNGGLAIAFRVIKSVIPDIDSLGLPQIVRDLAHLPRGLVLVTGPTGSGKSTTLAAMVDRINRDYSRHIITIEDPIEYQFTNSASIIEQREIGADCPSFASGLRHVLRQDHLVFSTLHTINASQTIERIIDIYPANQQGQIRTMLANSLQAVISQTLFRRADEPGMIPATEIMTCTSAVRNCIRENRIFEIPNIIETGQRLGMQTIDQGIANLLSCGYIHQDAALAQCSNPGRMENYLKSKSTAECS